jgi:hypothetical protein
MNLRHSVVFDIHKGPSINISFHFSVYSLRLNSPHNYLKETESREFRPLVFHQTIPSRFRISLRIRREINEYVLFRAMPHSDGLFYRICMKTNTVCVVPCYAAKRWTMVQRYVA